MSRIHARGAKSVQVENLERRRLMSVDGQVVQETVVIGFGGYSGVTFTSDTGVRTGISVGRATATITFSGLGIPINILGHTYFRSSIAETVESIAITNAIPNRAALQIRTAPIPVLVNVGSISGGNLAAINAPDCNLTGSINVSSVGSVLLGSVSGATLNLGGAVASVRILKSLTGVVNLGTLGSLRAGSITNTTINATAPFSPRTLDIRSIDGGAGIEQSQIFSVGNIGTVRARFIDKSVITAGTTAAAAPSGQYPVSVLPESSGSFYDPSIIHSIVVVRVRGAGFFSDSVIAASTIVSANLGQAGTVTGGGIAAHRFGAVVIQAPQGSLDLATVHLGGSQLSNSVRLASVLSARGVAQTDGVLGDDNVQFYGISLNVLR